MNRETKTFTTPIGKQEVVINAWLTGREKRELTNIFLRGDLKFNTESNNVSGIDFSLVDKEQDLAWKLVVVSIDGKKDGDIVDDKPFSVVEAILDMRSEDYDEVVRQVNGVKGDAAFEKKRNQ